MIFEHTERQLNSLMQQGYLFKNWPSELCKQFFKEKNQVRLEELTPESTKKVWWKCAKGSDHIWLEAVSSRYQGRELGCPFCRGVKLSETNNLAKKHPKLAKEFLPQFNEGQIPNLYLPSSPKKVWWKCSQGEDHLWQETIRNRVDQDKGCPFCEGSKVSSTNCLSTRSPKIAKQWHFEKNYPLTPDQVKPDTSKKVWWKCAAGEDHEWEEGIKSRIQNKTSCPFCEGSKVSETNSLEAIYPKIAAEWNFEKNEDLLPNQFLPDSKKRVWWLCPSGEDHQWQAPIAERVKKKKKACPYCEGKIASTATSIVGKFPEVAEQWHEEKNEDLAPEEFFPESLKKVWWKCAAGEDHEWEASIKSRTLKQGECPFCAGVQLSLTNCFGTLYPELASQWHLKKNEAAPEEFFPEDGTVVWWKCEEGPDHQWEESIANRIANPACPFCAGELLSKMNSLKAKYPELAKEWHSKFNKKLKPEEFLPETNKLVWWKCAGNPDHVWMESIVKRVEGANCLDCQIIREMKDKK